MASITVRNLDESVKKRLRRQAAEHGRSLEGEVREILSRASQDATPERPKNGLEFFQPIRDVVQKYGGVDLDISPRTPTRPVDLWPESEHRPIGTMQEAGSHFRLKSVKPPKQRSKR